MAVPQQQLRLRNSLSGRKKNLLSLSSTSLSTVLLAFAVFFWCMITMTLWVIDSSAPSTSDPSNLPGGSSFVRRHPANKLAGLSDDIYGAMAMDVQKSLQCDSIGAGMYSMGTDDVAMPVQYGNDRRRLEGDLEWDQGGWEEGAWDDKVGKGHIVYDDDPEANAGGLDYDYGSFDPFGYGDSQDFGGNFDYQQNGYNSATHLMCLAAAAPNLKPEHSFNCDPLSPTIREQLLDLWSDARSQVPLDILKKSLDFAFESRATLMDKTVYLWYPDNDSGFDYAYGKVSSSEYRSDLQTLPMQNRNSIFVDVGSHQGLVSLAVKLLYPETPVISIEPAAPNFIMQKLNFICNLPPNDESKHPPSKQPQPISILAGIGHKNNFVAKLNWQPFNTAATRSWTPSAESMTDDVELLVRLRTLRSVMAEAMPEDLPYTFPTPITVLKLGCEGCEYNIVPAWSDEEFESIPAIMGDMHFGYIPFTKKPSSKRTKKTNERLCQHVHFAKAAIECCDFKNSPVRDPSNSFSAQLGTVKDFLPPLLCDNFPTWAEENHLNDIEDDFGWFELTSTAIEN